MKTKLLKLSEIITTAGTQIRASINADAVDQYAEAMLDSANKFPPVVVFHDSKEYILADGFHRVMAASRNGFKDIEAEVRKGTKSDALKYALSANATHGIRRTNADKRRSVELALSEWPKLSDREIARICAVGNKFVGDVRSELCLEHSSKNETRIGADGKTRKLPTRKTASDSEPEPEEERPRVRTLDEEWKQALGKAEIPTEPAPELTPVQSAIVDLDCVCERAAGNISSTKDKAQFKARLLHWAEQF